MTKDACSRAATESTFLCIHYKYICGFFSEALHRYLHYVMTIHWTATTVIVCLRIVILCGHRGRGLAGHKLPFAKATSRQVYISEPFDLR